MIYNSSAAFNAFSTHPAIGENIFLKEFLKLVSSEFLTCAAGEMDTVIGRFSGWTQITEMNYEIRRGVRCG